MQRDGSIRLPRVWQARELPDALHTLPAERCMPPLPRHRQAMRGLNLSEKPHGRTISNELRAQLIARDRLDHVREYLVRIEDLIQDYEKYKGVLSREKMKMPCLRFCASVRTLRHAIAALCAVKEGR